MVTQLQLDLAPGISQKAIFSINMDNSLASNDKLAHEPKSALAEDGKYFMQLNVEIPDKCSWELLGKRNFQNLLR